MDNTGYISPIAIHPGITLKETLETINLSQKDLSLRTGLTEKTISEIINGKNPITLETALSFEKVLGVSRDFWISLQQNYDKDKLRLYEQKRLRSEIELLDQFKCYNELASRGIVKKTRNNAEKVSELMQFYSVNSLELIKHAYPAQFRITGHSKLDKNSLIAWLRLGEIEAKEIATKNFDRKKLRSNIPELKQLTKEAPEYFSKRLKEIFADCGIVLVFVPHLKNTYVNGATKWLTPNRALIQLSLRNKWSDIFWFTLFHELGHLYSGKKQPTLDYDGKQYSEEEEKADNFALNNLINRYKYEEFFTNLDFKKSDSQIYKFANEIGVDVSIVAGRIGRETGQWARVRKYRKRIEFNSKW